MKLFKTAASLQTDLRTLRLAGRRIGLVPTMGNLHAGHLSLVEQAKQHCDYVVVTIFVNPLQFGPNEDFERYPRTFDADSEQLNAAGCDAVFVPSVAEMYPKGLDQQTVVSVPALSNLHCGASRPGHFAGVCTVVNKLFNLTGPDQAFFGDKDFQQLLIIKKMVADLCMPIVVTGVPIHRETSGLAMSSRNSFLSPAQKKTAANLYASLTQAKSSILDDNCRTYKKLTQSLKKTLTETGMEVDYLSVCNARTLEPASLGDTELVILSAVYLGKEPQRTRLIDNVRLSLISSTN